jgi:hypothetical protein
MSNLVFAALLALAAVAILQAVILVDHAKRLVALRHRLAVVSPAQAGAIQITGEEAWGHLRQLGSDGPDWRALLPNGHGLIVWLHPRSFASRHLGHQLTSYVASARGIPPPVPVVILLEGSRREVTGAVAQSRLDPTITYWVGDQQAIHDAFGLRWRPGVLSIKDGQIGRAAQVYDIAHLVEFTQDEFGDAVGKGRNRDAGVVWPYA